jgi:phosphoribosylformimino-5-aminoimidazole carboxamide ribotide isomerase
MLVSDQLILDFHLCLFCPFAADHSYFDKAEGMFLGGAVLRLPRTWRRGPVFIMTTFRPCIDLHQGVVKQIVGGSLRDEGAGPTENFVSEKPSGWFAERFRLDGLTGGHVIKLGAGNDAAAREALAAWPGGLQIGGGIHAGNATEWLDAGASHVIVTSALFDTGGRFLENSLRALVAAIGGERLVIDLSCRRTPDGWTVAMNRWQTPTDLRVDHATLDRLAPFCAEFLIHAADVEGLCRGIDGDLVQLLGAWGKCPITYAGGAASMEDVRLVDAASGGKVDVTVGSALDLFGGSGVGYDELVRWNGR